ncbi:MAG: transposase [Bryobacterales bacterium]|nr:transposase [Bryobacterales bacterium]
MDDEDRHPYLDLLAKAAEAAQLSVLGYCLMTNHVHWIAVPVGCDSLALALREAHRNSSRWLNIRLRRCGHVWQNRYFSCPLDPAHAAYAMR